MIMDDEDKRLDCHVLDSDRDKELLKLQKLISTKDALQFGIDGGLQTAENVRIEPEELLDTSSDQLEINPDAPVSFGEENDSSEDDSDLEPYPMEEESNDDQESRTEQGKKLGRPVYAFDLLQYIRAADDPVKQDVGLSSASVLIRQKAGIGREIEENAHELAKAIYALHDTFHLQKFDEYQQEAIVALMVAAPEPTYSVIIDEFYDRSSSDSQRSLALRCISLSVKELAGWGDSKHSDKFLDGAVDSLNDMLSGSLALEPAGTSAPINTVGKTRVFSKKSEIDRRRAKPTRNRLAGIVSKLIFFPLIQGWWEGTRTGFSNHTTRIMATQSPHLLSRFIMTLGIVMYFSIHTPEHQHMVKEFWDFALSMRFHTFHGTTESTVVHAALLGINTIVNTSMKEQKERLITDYARQLVETRDWVAGKWI
ncbi:telomere binding protein [Umbelopsis sp. WA50703]